MFSNLASYIFGSSEQEAVEVPQEDPLIISHSSIPSMGPPSGVPTPTPRAAEPPSHSIKREESSRSDVSDDDWVVVGGSAGHAPALGSLNDMMPRPPTGSTGSSATPSEEDFAGDQEEMVIVQPHDGQQAPERAPLTRSGRRLTAPFSCQNAVVNMAQMKAARSAQVAKLKSTKRSNTAKATGRQNKAVKHRSGFSKKTASCRDNLSIKSSGFQKQLKQC